VLKLWGPGGRPCRPQRRDFWRLPQTGAEAGWRSCGTCAGPRRRPCLLLSRGRMPRR